MTFEGIYHLSELGAAPCPLSFKHLCYVSEHTHKQKTSACRFPFQLLFFSLLQLKIYMQIYIKL